MPIEAIRMIPGHKHLVFEEGLQSAWLYETLSPRVDDTVVVGITTSRGQESDKVDVYALDYRKKSEKTHLCPDSKLVRTARVGGEDPPLAKITSVALLLKR